MQYSFDNLLEESVRTHGHLCPGQVLGVRMSMLGLKLIDIDDPRGRDRKNIIVFVEMDRCATDAVQSVTGVSLGKRTMKYMDYGKMAATYLNLKTGKAVRILALEEARDKARIMFPDATDRHASQLEAYKLMPDEDLFKVNDIEVILREEDAPGRPIGRVRCDVCGEHVQDRREVLLDGSVLCRPCAGDSYYCQKPKKKLPGDMQKLHIDGHLEIRSKLWLESDGEPVFGRGRRFLLEAIKQHGSINKAASEINISYRKAWGYIKAMEDRLGIMLVIKTKGGKNGGGAELTSEAEELLKWFGSIERIVRISADRKFKDTIKEISYVR